MKSDAREVALQALAACRKRKAWSEEALNSEIKRAELNSLEAALASRLCYTVLQNRSMCDFYISQFSSVKQNKIEPLVYDILCLGISQLVFMTKIPASAAVNESVKMTHRHSNKRAAGFVNAVLRKIASNLESLPEPDKNNYIDYLTVKYSHPKWFVEELIESLGELDTEELLKANNQVPPIAVHINTLKTSIDEVIRLMENDGISAERHPWLDNCLNLFNPGNVVKMRAYEFGYVQIQDVAARLAVLAAAPKPEQLIIDGCAAPGGKTLAAAMIMKNRGKVISGDIHENKLKRIITEADRLGVDIVNTVCWNAKENIHEYNQAADVVICDVPCSGMGIIRKKPDMRSKNKDELKNLPDIQFSILENLSRYVKPRGVIVYSTCTVRKAENDDVIDRFLEVHPEFCLEAFLLPGAVGEVTDGRITLYPHMHDTDGFYICKMRRIG